MQLKWFFHQVPRLDVRGGFCRRDNSVRFLRHLIWALIWRVRVWAEVCAHVCVKGGVMTGLRRSNDRDFTISRHNTNQTHPGLVSVLLPLLKKGLFTQGSDYKVPLTHYPRGVSHFVPLFGAHFLSPDARQTFKAQSRSHWPESGNRDVLN